MNSLTSLKSPNLILRNLRKPLTSSISTLFTDRQSCFLAANILFLEILYLKRRSEHPSSVGLPKIWTLINVEGRLQNTVDRYKLDRTNVYILSEGIKGFMMLLNLMQTSDHSDWVISGFSQLFLPFVGIWLWCVSSSQMVWSLSSSLWSSSPLSASSWWSPRLCRMTRLYQPSTGCSHWLSPVTVLK